MLFTRLQCEAVGGATVCIYGDANESTRKRALEGVACGHEGGVWAAVPHRNAESLTAADHHIGTLRACALHEHGGEWVSGNDHEQLQRMRRLNICADRTRCTATPRIRDQQRERSLAVARRRSALEQLGSWRNHEGDVERLSARLQHVNRLRVRICINEHQVAVSNATHRMRERHRLRGCSPFVKERRVRDLHPSDIADSGLEVEQRLKATLRNLWLVRRVGGVPGGILQDVALDDWRRNRVVIARANKALQRRVACCHLAECCGNLRLGSRGGNVEWFGTKDALRHGVVDQRAE